MSRSAMVRMIVATCSLELLGKILPIRLIDVEGSDSFSSRTCSAVKLKKLLFKLLYVGIALKTLGAGDVTDDG